MMGLSRIVIMNKGSLLASKERHKLKMKALIRCADPIGIEELDKFKVDGRMTLQSFKDNLSKLFPLILHLVAEGDSIADIESLMGFNRRVLEQWIQNHPPFDKRIKEARKIRRDRIELAKMLE
jgi:hypothetical protein